MTSTISRRVQNWSQKRSNMKVIGPRQHSLSRRSSHREPFAMHSPNSKRTGSSRHASHLWMPDSGSIPSTGKGTETVALLFVLSAVFSFYYPEQIGGYSNTIPSYAASNHRFLLPGSNSKIRHT